MNVCACGCGTPITSDNSGNSPYVVRHQDDESVRYRSGVIDARLGSAPRSSHPHYLDGYENAGVAS